MSLTAAECSATLWDAIVVGTGMGGATTGYELARQGWRVLFIEKGPFLHGGFAAAPPGISQAVVAPAATPEREQPDSAVAPLLAEGHWPHRVRARTNFGTLNFRVPTGCVSGGSSAFYAAALERFSPADFSPRANFPGAVDSTLPEYWPVSYQELAPFYTRAEQLFRVRGTPDPLYPDEAAKLLDPPGLSPRDEQLLVDFQGCGLHPYRVHVGCEFLAGCDGCPNGPCERGCKRDAAWTCLMPALSRYDAVIFPDCEVVRLDASATTVDKVICRQGDREWHIRGRMVVLAAGAFATPVLLLRSRSPAWPTGIGNQADLVGRNLMFHGGDFIAVSSSVVLDGDGAQKTLATNDFYHTDGHKLGTFQTLGVRLELGQIMQYLRETAESSTAWWKWLLSPRPVWWRKLTSPFIRLAAMLYVYLYGFRNASVWVSIIEDLPYRENRVYVDPDSDRNIVIDYRYSDELSARVSRFRSCLRQALGRDRLMILSLDRKIDYPHVSGTCRFGDDPATSVLDPNNRVHGMTNLYVVDASFFPSSSGTNPSLTIAANALRVAGDIHQVLSRASAGSSGSSASTATQ